MPERLQGLQWEFLSDPIELESARARLVFQNEYVTFPSVPTFRGNPQRNGGAWGRAGDEKLGHLELQWNWELESDSGHWQGIAGWTGQPALVRWPDSIRTIMNLDQPYRSQNGLVEVIQASLNGKIYFLDLASGLPTRPALDLGNPVKGSVSVHPEGLPLLFVGQGIRRSSPPGIRLINLLDQSQAFSLSGEDPASWRSWSACDGSAVFFPKADAMVVGAENGLVYFLTLGTNFSVQDRTLTLNPRVQRYRYRMAGKSKLGIENSVAGWKNLLVFADNGGLLQGFDMVHFRPVWTRDVTDDTDASVVIGVENDVPFLYTGCEVDLQGSSGSALLRKFDGRNGNLLWERSYSCRTVAGERPVNGGVLGTPALGAENSDHLVFFALARFESLTKGALVALDRKTGREEWRVPLKQYPWSSPTLIRTAKGRSYLIQCTSGGVMYLIDASSGEILDQMMLDSNIEASPAVMNDRIVVATRGRRIYCLRVY